MLKDSVYCLNVIQEIFENLEISKRNKSEICLCFLRWFLRTWINCTKNRSFILLIFILDAFFKCFKKWNSILWVRIRDKYLKVNTRNNPMLREEEEYQWISFHWLFILKISVCQTLFSSVDDSFIMTIRSEFLHSINWNSK